TLRDGHRPAHGRGRRRQHRLRAAYQVRRRRRRREPGCARGGLHGGRADLDDDGDARAAGRPRGDGAAHPRRAQGSGSGGGAARAARPGGPLGSAAGRGRRRCARGGAGADRRHLRGQARRRRASRLRPAARTPMAGGDARQPAGRPHQREAARHVARRTPLRRSLRQGHRQRGGRRHADPSHLDQSRGCRGDRRARDGRARTGTRRRRVQRGGGTMMSQRPRRFLILGGGFGGVYTALTLEKLLKKEIRRGEVELGLVSRENYMVFQPMLPEVISGSIGLLDTITPIRRLCPNTNLYTRTVESIDLDHRGVMSTAGFGSRQHHLHYDHLVLALGNVTSFAGQPGLAEYALPFKYLGDALTLRNRLIHTLEEADIEQDPDLRRALLTFVVAGGGFSGVEAVAELNDFVHAAAKGFRNLRPEEIRVVLLHAGRLILPELPASLAEFAQRLLARRGA